MRKNWERIDAGNEANLIKNAKNPGGNSAYLIESIIEVLHNEGTFLNHLQSSQETMHSSSTMTSTLSLSLPPELWSMILSTFRSSLLDCFDKENATYLWTQCRLGLQTIQARNRIHVHRRTLAKNATLRQHNLVLGRHRVLLL